MGENKGKETKVRRQFDREFKNGAVRLVELSNRSVKQVAQELDTWQTPPGAGPNLR
jgi:transposase-like protein